MPFNTLLLTGCFLPGKTSFKENGVEIKVQPESGETILFFSIDEQSNPSCKLRQVLKIDRQNMKICDLIVFYGKDNHRVICFVELKGSDLERAVEQVENKYKSLTNILSSRCNSFISKAYIKTNSSAPQEIKQYQEQLSTTFGKNNYDISKNSDLGDFIRGATRKARGKRKKK
ncbi:MAG: hypothetical protein QNJ47_14575 [Nostocaceae cyanobacterium]|nr:hypothetical protein [Nostocaceae cyanobacterium]